MTAPDTSVDRNELNCSERGFLDAVLVCQGILKEATDCELQRATRVLAEYARQVQGNPPEGVPSLIVRRWLAPLSSEARIKIAAAAFVRFGATKPNIFQVRAAHREIFGTALQREEL